MDPAIDKRVTVRMKDRDMESALAELVSPLGYALVWSEVDGPLGRISRLKQLSVFRIGKENAVQPIETNNNLRISQGWNGRAYVTDELLVGFSEAMTGEEFHLLLAQWAPPS